MYFATLLASPPFPVDDFGLVSVLADTSDERLKQIVVDDFDLAIGALHSVAFRDAPAERQKMETAFGRFTSALSGTTYDPDLPFDEWLAISIRRVGIDPTVFRSLDAEQRLDALALIKKGAAASEAVSIASAGQFYGGLN